MPVSAAAGGILVAEGLVYLEQHLLLALSQMRVAEDCRGEVGVTEPLLQDAGPDVERLRGDPQRSGDLLQDLRAGLAQPALDLGQVRVAHAGELGQLAEGDLGGLALLADVLPELADLQCRHRADLLLLT